MQKYSKASYEENCLQSKSKGEWETRSLAMSEVFRFKQEEKQFGETFEHLRMHRNDRITNHFQ